jgi:hypothetical protein
VIAFTTSTVTPGSYFPAQKGSFVKDIVGLGQTRMTRGLGDGSIGEDGM